MIASNNTNCDIKNEKEQNHIEEKSNNPEAERLSRVEYTSAVEQKEIADGLASVPSVDNETQLAIALEFRALHERIQSEGFYECRYSEYGKEMIRYLLLFSAFIFLLRAEWYLTSACFLGMFWVRSGQYTLPARH